MADLFSTNVMVGVVRALKIPSSFLLDKFFPKIQEGETEEIHFDVINRTRRIAPFVSPLVAGKVVQSQGYTTNTFKPAYIKDKRVFDATRPMKRVMGEQLGGITPPANRISLLMGYDLEDQIHMINRRMEVMAAETLRLGKVTVSGEEYPTVVVDYGRAVGHTITLSGGNRWNQAGIKPLDNLQDWAQTVLQASGAMPVDVVMTVDVWKVFRADADVQSRLVPGAF